MSLKDIQKHYFSRVHQIKQAFYKGVAALALVVMSASSAQAAFVSMGHDKFGSGSLTLDASTSLQWLDIGFANGWSYNKVVDAMGTGGKFDGFRHATSAEVFQLLENFGFDLSLKFGENWAAHFTSSEKMFSYFGWLHGDPSKYHSLQGITADSLSVGEHERIGVGSCYTNEVSICSLDGHGKDTGEIFIESYEDHRGFLNLSHWLIWDPQSIHSTPEPSIYSMLLLGLGIAGIAARRRKRSIQ